MLFTVRYLCQSTKILITLGGNKLTLIAAWFYRVAFWLDSKGLRFLGKLVNVIFVRCLCSCQIGLGFKLAKGVSLGYGGLGVVIHKNAVIGENVVIGDCVTIGGTTKKSGVPEIGDGCLLSSGAVILGPIKIGKNCVVGANAVVTKDFSDNSVIGGIPARVLKDNININDYRNFKN